MKIRNLFVLGLFTAISSSTLFSQNYEVYVSDAGNFNLPPWQILKFDQHGENGQVFISEHLAWPQDIFFLEQENAVLITNLNTGAISKFNATTGAFIAEFATGIAGPTRMELGPDTLLYVLQWQGNGKVKRYQLDGTFLGDFTATGVASAIGLDWDASGQLYVSSYNGKYVRRFDQTGADLGNFISDNLLGPTNIWFVENGDLMVLDYNGGSVKRFDSEGNFLGIFITGLPQGEGVDFTPDGNIVLGCGGTSSVRVYDSTGSQLSDLVPPATLGLKTPNAVVFRPIAPSSTKELYVETTLVKPSVGSVFQLAQLPETGTVPFIEVYNGSGMMVQKINPADSTIWDANHLSNGAYRLIAKQTDGTILGQQIVVQH